MLKMRILEVRLGSAPSLHQQSAYCSLTEGKTGQVNGSPWNMFVLVWAEKRDGYEKEREMVERRRSR